MAKRIRELLEKYPPTGLRMPIPLRPIKPEPPRYEIVKEGPADAKPYVKPVGPFEVSVKPWNEGLHVTVTRAWQSMYTKDVTVKAYHRLIPARWVKLYREVLNRLSRAPVYLDEYWGPMIKAIPRATLLKLIPEEELKRLTAKLLAKLPGVLKYAAPREAIEFGIEKGYILPSQLIEAIGVDTILKYVPEAAVIVEPTEAKPRPVPAWQRVFAALLCIPESMPPHVVMAISGVGEDEWTAAWSFLKSRGLATIDPMLPIIHGEGQITSLYYVEPLEPRLITHVVASANVISPERATPRARLKREFTVKMDRYVYVEPEQTKPEEELWKALPVDLEAFLEPPTYVFAPRKTKPFDISISRDEDLLVSLEWNDPDVWRNPEKGVDYVSWYPPDSKLWSPPELRTKRAVWKRKATPGEAAGYVRWLKTSYMVVEGVKKSRLEVLNETARRTLDSYVESLLERLPPTMRVRTRIMVLD